jgi:hypothetical protein
LISPLKLIRINQLQKEIDHLFEFGDFGEKEDDLVIFEKTKELVCLQAQVLDELERTTYH